MQQVIPFYQDNVSHPSLRHICLFYYYFFPNLLRLPSAGSSLAFPLARSLGLSVAVLTNQMQ